MAPRLDELEAAYRADVSDRRALLDTYMARSRRSSMTDAERNAKAIWVDGREKSIGSLRNYKARAHPGSHQITIDRARSEFFTNAFDDVAKLQAWCEVRDAEHGSDQQQRLAELRGAVFSAWWKELMSLHAWWTAKDAEAMMNRMGPENRERYLRSRYPAAWR